MGTSCSSVDGCACEQDLCFRGPAEDYGRGSNMMKYGDMGALARDEYLETSGFPMETQAERLPGKFGAGAEDDLGSSTGSTGGYGPSLSEYSPRESKNQSNVSQVGARLANGQEVSVRTWEIQVHRQPGTCLGICVERSTSVSSLHVYSLSGSNSIIDIWNHAHPSFALAVGDLIVGVNGRRGDVDILIQQLSQKGCILDVEVARVTSIDGVTVEVTDVSLSQPLPGLPLIFGPGLTKTEPPIPCAETPKEHVEVQFLSNSQEAVGVSFTRRPLGLSFGGGGLPPSLVTKVTKGGHAQELGVEVGWNLRKIGGTPISDEQLRNPKVLAFLLSIKPRGGLVL